METFPTVINQLQNEENTGYQKWQNKTLNETLKHRNGMKQSEKNLTAWSKTIRRKRREPAYL